MINQEIRNIGIFSLVAALVIGLMAFIAYSGYQSVLTTAHDEIAELEKKTILTYVASYNHRLEKMYQDINAANFVAIANLLNNIPTDFSNINSQHIKEIKRIAIQHDVDIEIVDKTSTQILFDTRDEFTGTYISKWERPAKNIKQTKPGEIHYHYTWTNIYFYLFVYYQPMNSDLVWVVYERSSTANSKLHQIISFLKFDQSIRANIEHLALYDDHLSPIHGLKNFPKKLFEGNNFGASTLRQSGTTYYWIPVLHNDGKSKDKQVRYVGFSTNVNRFLDEKLANTKLGLLIASLSLWLLFMATLICLRRAHALSLARVSEQIEKCLHGNQNQIVIDENFTVATRTLAEKINSFVESLKSKAEHHKALASEIFDSCDKGQKKINHDLHDTVGQLLVAANLKLAKYPEVSDTRDLIKRASEELRTIYGNTEPPGLHELGLEKALKWYVVKFFHEDFACTIKVENTCALRGHFFSQIYRIAQELIANARKHNPDISFFDLAISQVDNKLVIRAHNDCAAVDAPIKMGNGLHNIKLRVEALAGYINFIRLDCDFIAEARIPIANL